MTIRLMTLLAIAIVALVLDPYTFGGVGGDEWYPSIAWQRLVGGVQLLLLAGAMLIVAMSRYRYLQRLLGVEATIFLAFNIALLLRDGTLRLVVGYSAAPLLLLLLIAGVIVRAALIRATVRHDSNRGTSFLGRTGGT
jgi:hypothetical protein